MLTYNTTLAPIIFKDYGRNMQNLIQEIAKMPEKLQQTEHMEGLTTAICNIGTSKSNQTELYIEKAKADILVISNPKLHPETTLPKQEKHSIKKQGIKFHASQNQFKCCGNNLVKLIKKVFEQAKTNEPTKEEIIEILRLIQSTHKEKNNLRTILEHLEKIVHRKISVPYEEIEKAVD